MKNKIYILLTVFSLFLISCSKQEKPMQIDNFTALSIVHCAPNTPNLGIVINGQNLNLSQFGYRTRTNYFNLYSGSYNFLAYSADRNPSTPFLSNNLNLKSNTIYSLFLINSLFKMESLLIEDKIIAPAKGKAKVRFVNLSPDMSGIDFYVSNQTNPIVKNLAYKRFSDFIEFDINQQVEFSIKNSGEEEWIYAPSLPNKILTSSLIKFEPTKNFYTVCLLGFKNTELLENELIIENFVHQ